MGVMNVSGPCFVIVKNGVPFNKYEVNATSISPLGFKTDSFYFDTKEDAEIYYLFLLQEDGEKELNRLLASDRTFLWEKEEYKAFKKSINWQELKDKVKTLHYTKITTFVKATQKSKK